MGRKGKSFEFFRVKAVPSLDSITPRGYGSVFQIFSFDMRSTHKSAVDYRDSNGEVRRSIIQDCTVHNIDENLGCDGCIKIEETL